MLDHYATVRLSAEFTGQVRQLLDEHLVSELGSLGSLRKRLRARLAELN